MTLGRYVLYEAFASGGMAQVHLGRLMGPVGFSRTVAIKRLHQHLARDPEFVTMFLDEARLAARVRHPNVVPVLDVVAAEGEVFLVMEYVQGEALSWFLANARKRKTPVPLAIAAQLMASALHGLHAAHEVTDERGEPLHIVHRDVSPQNILIGADGVARVVDFGVAKVAGRAQETRAGQLKGKVQYMPPEQVRSGPVTRTADVYSAGVVLWEMLTNDKLFRAENAGDLIHRVMELEVPLPSSRQPSVPPIFDAIVMRALDRDPDKRFPTAEAFASALESASATLPASAVAAWVKEIAGESLNSRARRLAEVESDASIPSAWPEGGPRPPESESPKSDPSAPSQLSGVSTERSQQELSREPPRRAKTALWVGAALLPSFALGALLLLRISAPAPQPPATATTTAEPKTAPIEPSASLAVPLSPSASASATAPPSAMSADPAASAAPQASDTKATKAPPRPATPIPASPPAKAPRSLYQRD